MPDLVAGTHERDSRGMVVRRNCSWGTIWDFQPMMPESSHFFWRPPGFAFVIMNHRPCRAKPFRLSIDFTKR